MKKIPIFLAFAIIILSLAACGSKKETMSPDTQPGTSVPAISSAVPQTSNAESETETTTEYDAEAIREEASAEFEMFLAAVEHTDGNDEWSEFFRTYRVYVETHGKQYEQYCNGTVEEWNDMSEYDRFLWYETYLRVVVYMHLGNHDRFFSSEKNFIDNTIFNAYNLLQRFEKFGNGTESEAYKTLMLWQYDYIKEYGTVYNFITGQNYLESLQD